MGVFLTTGLFMFRGSGCKIIIKVCLLNKACKEAKRQIISAGQLKRVKAICHFSLISKKHTYISQEIV